MTDLARLLGNRRAGATPQRGGNARKRRAAKALTKRLVNPVMRAVLHRVPVGVGTVLLETTGRRTGQPRQTPVGNGLRGDDFWIVTEHGWDADYVNNIQNNPRVRVKLPGGWRAGTAEILPGEDPYARMRALGRPLNDTVLLLVGTEQLVIRVRLDPEPR